MLMCLQAVAAAHAIGGGLAQAVANAFAQAATGGSCGSVSSAAALAQSFAGGGNDPTALLSAAPANSQALAECLVGCWFWR